MPRRAPIDPEGCYHVSSRGCYGQPLFRTVAHHELFLRIYAHCAQKYGWVTLDWALMKNHHHFVIQLTDGGLSEGMRVLHGTYSRRIHHIYGLTGQGHLVRHAFFARQLATEGEVLVTCRYIDLNATRAGVVERPEDAAWCGHCAIVGLEHPRPFHVPSALLAMINPSPAAAASAYRTFVREGLAV